MKFDFGHYEAEVVWPVVFSANKFREPLEPYLDRAGNPRMTYREYHLRVWEPWLKRCNSKSTAPFPHGPEEAFADSLDPHLLAYTEYKLQVIASDHAYWREPEGEQSERLSRWINFDRPLREKNLLDIFEALHRLYEGLRSPMCPVEMPEGTLEELAGGRGHGMLKLLVACRFPPDFDPANSDVLRFPHDDWDRL